MIENKLPSLLVHFKDPDLRNAEMCKGISGMMASLGDAFHASIAAWLWACPCSDGTEVLESAGRTILLEGSTVLQVTSAECHLSSGNQTRIISHAVCGTWMIY